MVTDALVDKLLDEGRKLIEDLPRGGFPVLAAVWFKASENGKWYFYIVSPLVDTEGIRDAYGRLHPLARARPGPYRIDPLEIRLVGPSNPIGRDVLAALHRIPGPHVSPMLWPGTILGNESIEAAYLYPPPESSP
jgi:hypothetical protein